MSEIIQSIYSYEILVKIAAYLFNLLRSVRHLVWVEVTGHGLAAVGRVPELVDVEAVVAG